MTTGPGRNRRRRGRRGQQSRPDDQRQQASPDQQQAPQERPPQRGESRSRASGATGSTSREAHRQRDAEQGQRRKRSRGKRRPNRRPALGPAPTHVLREHVRGIVPGGVIALHSLDEIDSAAGLAFGCPMLTRTGVGMPFAQGQRVPRCAMGWALHNEDEASFCMRTPDRLDCWREHPEREAELRNASDEENAAD